MKFFLFIAFFVGLIVSPTFAAKPISSAPITTPRKPKLVLMPIKVSEEDRSLSGAMETALVEGLQERYIVFSGDRVQQKTREIFTKESKTAKAECDETKCMEDIAIAFQAELIAVANVTRRDGGYFLAINIQNIFDNKVVYTKSRAYANQTVFQVIDLLRELTGDKKTYETFLTVALTDVWIDTTHHLMWQDQEYTREEKTHFENRTFGGKVQTYQGAMEYCEDLTLSGYSDWRLPNKDELSSLLTIGFYGKDKFDYVAWYRVNKGKSMNGHFGNPALKQWGWGYKNEERGGDYWSSSNNMNATNSAWYVGFGSSGTYERNKDNSFYLRCVRDNK